jgi:hypothetical protein
VERKKGKERDVERSDEKKQLLIDYNTTFNTAAGKRVKADIEKKSQFNSGVIPLDEQGRIDPLAMAYNEGKRALPIHINKMLKKKPKKQTKSKE